jgi:hypothetical protein
MVVTEGSTCEGSVSGVTDGVAVGVAVSVSGASAPALLDDDGLTNWKLLLATPR